MITALLFSLATGSLSDSSFNNSYVAPSGTTQATCGVLAPQIDIFDVLPGLTSLTNNGLCLSTCDSTSRGQFSAILNEATIGSVPLQIYAQTGNTLISNTGAIASGASISISSVTGAPTLTRFECINDGRWIETAN